MKEKVQQTNVEKGDWNLVFLDLDIWNSEKGILTQELIRANNG